jgi:hypothetical protein
MPATLHREIDDDDMFWVLLDPEGYEGFLAFSRLFYHVRMRGDFSKIAQTLQVIP